METRGRLRFLQNGRQRTQRTRKMTVSLCSLRSLAAIPGVLQEARLSSVLVYCLTLTLATSLPAFGFEDAGFVKKATWEETEQAANAVKDRVVPKRWLLPPQGVVPHANFDWLGAKGATPEMQDAFETGRLPSDWRFVEPTALGTLNLQRREIPGHEKSYRKQFAYTEYESPHEQWALFSWGCRWGFRLDFNDNMLIYGKWRAGDFQPDEFNTLVRLRQGNNRIFFAVMWPEVGDGAFQFAILPFERRINLLAFLIASFPEERERIASATDEFLSLSEQLGLSLEDATHKPAVEAVYARLRQDVEAGRHTVSMLAGFMDLCERYRYFETGEKPLIEKALAAAPAKSLRLKVSELRYHKAVGSEQRASALLRELQDTADVETARSVHAICRRFHAPADGLPLLRAVAERSQGPDRIETLARTADLLEADAQNDAAFDLYTSLKAHEIAIQARELPSPAARCLALRKKAEANDAMLPLSPDLKDALQVIKNQAESGDTSGAVTLFLERADRLNDMVTRIRPDLAIEAFDHLMEMSKALPETFRRALSAQIEQRLEAATYVGESQEAQAALQRLWPVLQGRGRANRLAVDYAARRMDVGDFETAKVWLNAAWSAEAHPSTAAMIGLAAAATRDSTLLRYVREQIERAAPGAAVDIGGKSQPLVPFLNGLAAGSLRQQDVAEPSAQSLVEGWRMRSEPPAVTATLRRQRSARSIQSSWGSHLYRVLLPVRARPALDGHTLVVLNGHHLEARDVRTGKQIWKTLVIPEIQGPGGRLEDRRTIPGPVFNPIVQDGVVVARVPERLCSFETGFFYRFVLCAIRLRDGKLLWTQPGVMADPVVHAGTVFVNTTDVDPENYWLQRKGDTGDTEFRADALDIVSGRPRWVRTLATGLMTSGDERTVAEVAAPLLTPEGVFFSSNYGVMTMFDPLTGRVRWLRQYTGLPRDPAACYYHVSQSLYADGLVIAAPRDSHSVFAIEARTGNIAWQTGTSRSPYLAGLWKNRLVFLGDAIRLLDLKTGIEQAKATCPLDRFPYPEFVGDTIRIGTLGGMRAFDLGTLQPAPVPRQMEVGDLYHHALGKYAVVVRPDSLTVFGENRERFGVLSAESVLESALADLRRGRLSSDPGAALASASPADAATYRMLLARHLRDSGKTAEAQDQARAILKDCEAVEPTPCEFMHRLRPAQFARRILGTTQSPDEAAQAPAEDRDVPVPVWLKHGTYESVEATPSPRGLLMLRIGDRLDMINLAGFGETQWSRHIGDSVSGPDWAPDHLLLWETNRCLALDIQTGEQAWTIVGARGSLQMAPFGNSFFAADPTWTHVACLDAASGKEKWRTDLPETRKRVRRLEKSGNRLYAYFSASRDDGTAWDVREFDTERREWRPPVLSELSGRPMGLEHDLCVTMTTNGNFVTVYSLDTGKRVWQSSLQSMSGFRVFRKPENVGYLFGVCRPGSSHLKQLFDLDGESFGYGDSTLYYHLGDVYGFDPRTSVLSKMTMARVKPKTKAAGDGEETMDDLARNLGKDLGLGSVGVAATAEDRALRISLWDLPFHGSSLGAWHWRSNTLAVVDTDGDSIRFRRIALERGRTADTIPLLWTPAPARHVSWTTDGRYCVLLTDSEVYGFRMMNKAEGQTFVAARRRAAEALAGDNRSAALRACVLADQVLAGTTNRCTVGGDGVRLDQAAQWVAHTAAAGGADTGWHGPDDVSATVRVQKSLADTLEFEIQVRDDHWEPFAADGFGDCVRFDVAGLSLWFGMDVSGAPLMDARGVSNTVAQVTLKEPVCRMLSAQSVRYSFRIGDWRRTLGLGPNTGSDSIGFSVAVRDNDGYGNKGELLWGGGSGVLMVK